MNKLCLIATMATAVAVLSGCASTAVTPPPRSAQLSNEAAKAASPNRLSNEANTTSVSDSTTEVVVYGSVPQYTPVPSLPCGLASLAWSLAHPEDAWRLIFPVLPNEDLDACMRDMRGDSPVPLHLQK